MNIKINNELCRASYMYIMIACMAFRKPYYITQKVWKVCMVKSLMNYSGLLIYIMRACMAFRIQWQIMQGCLVCTVWKYAGLWACNFNINCKYINSSVCTYAKPKLLMILCVCMCAGPLMKIWVIIYVIS